MLVANQILASSTIKHYMRMALTKSFSWGESKILKRGFQFYQTISSFEWKSKESKRKGLTQQLYGVV